MYSVQDKIGAEWHLINLVLLASEEENISSTTGSVTLPD